MQPDHASGTPEQGPPIRLFEPPPSDPPLPPLLWCPLDTRGLLRIEGSDAESFLQGQLTQDMARLPAGHALLAAHCTPKGRITALFRAWHDGQAFLLDLPEALAAAAQRRLSMYVLRSQVKIGDARGSWQRTAVGGTAMAATLAAAGIPCPEAVGAVRAQDGLLCLRVGPQRCVVASPAGADAGLRARLGAAQAADPAAWALASLREGEPEVLAPTVEAFLPQMLNLDTLDGVSFRKGCYTGQEIVARTHYLGRVKRRMRRFGYVGSVAPLPGALLPLDGSSAAGDIPGAEGTETGQAQVVWALATHDGGGEALAVAVSREDA